MFSKVYKTKNPLNLIKGFVERASAFFLRDAGETRTHDQWLKRPLLYQLSYRVNKIIDWVQEGENEITKNKNLMSIVISMTEKFSDFLVNSKVLFL